MFGSRNQQLADLDASCTLFVETVAALSTENFLKSLGDWTPRDITAHFIGWNRITLVGCAEICEEVEPFYFYDGTNDYRKVNAKFLKRFVSTDREALLQQVASSRDALVSYLQTIEEQDWESDRGVTHYRGGPATVARCVDSLLRDYRKHREEIVAGCP
jgi:hypothetical protein